MRLCDVDGCNEKYFAKGFCKRHYFASNYRKHLDDSSAKDRLYNLMINLGYTDSTIAKIMK